jgi:hypothetical protein
MTVDEMLANMRGDDPETYRSMGGMGLEGLYRPFTAAFEGGKPKDTSNDRVSPPTAQPPLGAGQKAPPQDDGTDSPLPHFTKARPDLYQQAYTTQELDPVRFSDVDIVLNGQYYNGAIHRLKGRIDTDQLRGVGLRGPLTIVGYGPEVTGKPTPNAGDETKPVDQWSDAFLASPQLHPEKWKAGILLAHWDTWRGGWTIPTILKGTLDADLTDTNGLASVPMTIKAFGSAVDSDGKPYGKVKVYCDLGGPAIPKGRGVVASYYQLENRWYVTSARCTA